jgi:2-dehydro-3-deoxyglucarate aldolase/4-hydroxy-2-oxoheptanedioate aldolase
MNAFRESLGQGKPLIGTLVTLGLPAVAEMISHCGFDWLWIDMEHSPLSLDQVQQLIQAKSEQVAAMVRIPVNDETWIKRVLDLGADGIVVPQIKTPDEAEQAVAAAKYPPRGRRSVGLARASLFGMDFAKHVGEANEQSLVFLQIEHVEGVRNINSILNVKGIDAIVIGPYDLSGSLGKLGDIQNTQVQESIQKVQKACQQHKVPIGIFALQPEQGKAYLSQGFQLLALGVDVHYLWNGAKASLELVRSEALAGSWK